MTHGFDMHSVAYELGLDPVKLYPNPLEPVQKFGAKLVSEYGAEPIDLVEFGQAYGVVSPYKPKELSNLQSLAAEVHGSSSDAPYLPGTEFYHHETEENIIVGEPGDYLEEALLSFKPGAVSAEAIVYSAFRRAGHAPPFPPLLESALITVTEDLIEDDVRLHEGEQ